MSYLNVKIISYAQGAERAAINAPMQVHDGLVLEVSEVELGVGKNWDEAH